MSGREESGNKLQWSNIQLTLDEKDRFGNETQRHLLTNLSGELSEGQLLAIMGPSGCGKTSLLSVLSGRVAYSSKLTLAGNVTINGESINTARLSKKIACVAQDDSLFAHLTVRETLYLAAYFLKGSGTSKQRIDNIVDAVMVELSLTKASETIVGSATRRGISGGEYKRVLIGKELMKKPRIIFLDEPTSGLDSFQAFAVIESMKTLATNGKVVVAVIHQPRSSIFAMFDQLLLLSGGKLMYCGAANEAVEYFSRLGYACPEHYNPADFFLDMLSVNYKSPTLEKQSTQRIETIAQQWGNLSAKSKQAERTHRAAGTSFPSFMSSASPGGPSLHPLSSPRGAGAMTHFTFPEEKEEFKVDSEHKEQQFDADITVDRVDEGEESDAELRAQTIFLSTRSDVSPSGAINAVRGWCNDFQLLLWRACVENLRNYGSILIRTVTVLFYAMVLSLIYQDLNFSQQSIQDRTGLLYFMLINQSFTPLFVLLDVFPSEKIIVSREILSGAYSASAYFVARVLAELPLQIALTSTYCTIIYWAVGLQPHADRYFTFLGVILMTTFTAMALGFLVSAASPSKLIASAVGPPILIILLLFGGFYINTDSLPVGSEWVRYLSLIYWGFQALTINEFRGEHFECDPYTASTVGCIRTGDQQIQKLSFENAHISVAVGMLAVLITGCLLLAYTALLFNREKHMTIHTASTLPTDPTLSASKDTSAKADTLSSSNHPTQQTTTQPPLSTQPQKHQRGAVEMDTSSEKETIEKNSDHQQARDSVERWSGRWWRDWQAQQSVL